MIVNMYSEAELIGMEASGLVTSFQELSQELIKKGVKVKVNALKNYDILHVHSFGPLSVLNILTEERPVVLTSHTVPEEIKYLYRGGKYFVKVFRSYMKSLYNLADLIISPSKFAKRRLRKIGVTKKIIVQSNGIDTSFFENNPKKGKKFRDRYGIRQDEKVVGCVGLPSKRKGLKVFEKVARKMPEVEFVWVGKNEFGKFLKDYSYLQNLKRQSPDNLTLTGFVEDIRSAYSAMDVFLFPTKIETEGLVVLEAMASETPVVTSRIDGLNWCDEGKYCLKAGSPKEYIRKINQLFDKNTKEEIMSNTKTLLQEKEIKNVASRMVKIYRNILRNR